MQHPKKNNIFAPDVAIVFLLSLVLFWYISRFLLTDITTHALHVGKINRGEGDYPPNFLYYLLVNIVSGFSTSKWTLLNACTVLLSLGVAYKYFVTRNCIICFFPGTNCSKLIILLSFCCIILFAIPDVFSLSYLHRYYLGRIVPNIWHNSTTIAVFPFAILLFWKQYHILQDAIPVRWSSLAMITSLIVVNILIKPSFFFVYAPVTCLALLLKFRISKKFFLSILPIITGLIAVYIMQQLIYTYNVGVFVPKKSELLFFQPFAAWQYLLPGWYIPVAIIISYLVPMSYFLLFRSFIMVKPELVYYIVSMLFIGLLISIFFLETGPRQYDGNFFWQNFICIYILDLVIVIDALGRYIHQQKVNRKLKIFIGIFFLHVLAGIGYFIQVFSQQEWR